MVNERYLVEALVQQLVEGQPRPLKQREAHGQWSRDVMAVAIALSIVAPGERAGSSLGIVFHRAIFRAARSRQAMKKQERWLRQQLASLDGQDS